jgi:cytoskeleton protein RodZ
VESLGARLKREREQRKMTLDEISTSTKIGTRFLIAIEDEQFDQLPGGIFNKGFIKAYARAVGVDEAEAVGYYELTTGASQPEIQPDNTLAVLAATPTAASVFPDEDSESGISRLPWEWFAIGLLLVAFGFAIWGFHTRENPVHPVVAPTPSSELNSAPALQTAEPAMLAIPKQAETDASSSTPGSQTTAAVTAPEPSAAPKTFLVQIQAQQDSWIAITADGHQIMQDTLHAASEKSVEAHDQIVIKTGNAGALDISFNGKKLQQQGAPSEVKTFTFDSSGLKP